MIKSEISPRTDYALREKSVPDTPLQRVRIIEHIRGNKWEAEWVDPKPGLIDYAESGHLICRWKDHKAFLREEAETKRLRQYNNEIGFEFESPLDKAVHQVFESVGDDLDYDRGILWGTADALERIKQRAGVPSMPNSPFAYTSRSGRMYFPFDYALELAREFCASEPATVLVGVESTER